MPLKHLKGVGIGMTPLSDWLNVLPRGSQSHRTIPLPPKGMLWHVVLTLKSCACNINTALYTMYSTDLHKTIHFTCKACMVQAHSNVDVQKGILI